MMARWCVSILIFTLTLFGVVSQQQIEVPNQEIVLQFVDVDLTSNAVQNTIEVVKKQLRDVGGSHIQVKALENGKLRISYFSDADISSVKKAFSDDLYSALSYASKSNGNDSSKAPLEHSSIEYDFDIYEIQSSSNTGWDFDGAIVLQLDTKSDRFLEPNLSLSIGFIETISTKNSYKTSYKVCENVSLTFSESLHVIPEVRAGPSF